MGMIQSEYLESTLIFIVLGIILHRLGELSQRAEEGNTQTKQQILELNTQMNQKIVELNQRAEERNTQMNQKILELNQHAEEGNTQTKQQIVELNTQMNQKIVELNQLAEDRNTQMNQKIVELNQRAEERNMQMSQQIVDLNQHAEERNMQTTQQIVELKTEVGVIKKELKKDVGALKSDVAGLKTDVGVLKTDIGEMKSNQDWMMKLLPERVDFWHISTKNDKAPQDRHRREIHNKAKVYYACPKPKCALTGWTGDGVVLAHLLRRNNPDLVFSHFGLNAEDARDGERNVMFLCRGLEEAFDDKKISFEIKKNEETHEYEYHLKIWDNRVESKVLYPKAGKKKTIGSLVTDEKTGEMKPAVLKFANKENMPYSRILSYHHRLCYYHAKMCGWLNDDDAVPSQYGTPLKDIPDEININDALDMSFSDQFSISKNDDVTAKTASTSTGDVTSNSNETDQSKK